MPGARNIAGHYSADPGQSRVNSENVATLRALRKQLEEIEARLDAISEESHVRLRAESDLDTQPLAEFLDPHSGSLRSLIDPNGFPVGNWSEWTEDWRGVIGVHTLTGWQQLTGGTGGTLSTITPAGTRILRCLRWTCAAASSSNLLYCSQIFQAYTGLRFVYNQIVRTGVSIDTGSSVDIVAGIAQSIVAGPSWSNGINFRLNPDQSANVRVETPGNAAIDTGVVLKTDTDYRLKIVLLGSDNHHGTGYLAHFFINGNRVASAHMTTANVEAAAYAPILYLDNNGGATAYTCDYGPIRACWNHQEDLDRV